MDVSIIIVNYKTCNLVQDCINSIFEKTKGVSYEVIVVDNNSNDGSVETLSLLYPKIKVISLNENIGFGKANNIGFKSSIGKFVFFLNSDTKLLNDAISILANYLANHDSVALCGGQLYDGNGNPTGSYLEYPNYYFFLSLIFKGNVLYKNLLIFPEGEVPYYISGADMMLRRTFIDKYGAFDPDFFMYYEDTELSFRVQKLGFGVHFVPSAKIIHLHDMSPKEKGPKISDLDLYVVQSRYLYLKKVKGIAVMEFFLFLHIVKSYLAISYYSIVRNDQKVKNWRMLKKILEDF